jgi:hypothetical protein
MKPRKTTKSRTTAKNAQRKPSKARKRGGEPGTNLNHNQTFIRV